MFSDDSFATVAADRRTAVVFPQSQPLVILKIKKLCLTSHYETVNISAVELLLRHNK